MHGGHVCGYILPRYVAGEVRTGDTTRACQPYEGGHTRNGRLRAYSVAIAGRAYYVHGGEGGEERIGPVRRVRNSRQLGWPVLYRMLCVHLLVCESTAGVERRRDRDATKSIKKKKGEGEKT